MQCKSGLAHAMSCHLTCAKACLCKWETTTFYFLLYTPLHPPYTMLIHSSVFLSHRCLEDVCLQASLDELLTLLSTRSHTNKLFVLCTCIATNTDLSVQHAKHGRTSRHNLPSYPQDVDEDVNMSKHDVVRQKGKSNAVKVIEELRCRNTQFFIASLTRMWAQCRCNKA